MCRDEARPIRVTHKLWLEVGGEYVFGFGLASLLECIERLGSIHQAAGFLGMSYRQAWGRLNEAENRLGVKLLNRTIGGESGGGATLTPAGSELLVKYRELKSRVDEAVRSAFDDIFASPNGSEDRESEVPKMPDPP